MEGRYIIYGVVPSQHADNNRDTPEDQRIGGTVPIYGTDDKEEAKRLVNVEGGFFRNDQWYAATWAKDTVGGGTIGNVPTEASS
jgi:hypothetical protein